MNHQRPVLADYIILWQMQQSFSTLKFYFTTFGIPYYHDHFPVKFLMRAHPYWVASDLWQNMHITKCSGMLGVKYIGKYLNTNTFAHVSNTSCI